MKYARLIFAFIFIASYNLSNSQIIQFSDANLKSALLEDNVADIDGDGSIDGDLDLNDDGEIQISEAEAATYLRLTFKQISDFSEIHHFKNLTRLDLENNQLTTIDVSALSQLKILDIRNNLFEEIIIENMLSIEEIDYYPNDLLKNVSFKGCQNLVELSSDFIHLDKWDISFTNEALVREYILKAVWLVDSVIVTNSGVEDYLSLGTGFQALQVKYLDLRNNNIDTLEIPRSSYENLNTLHLDGNPISQLEMQDLPLLTNMDLDKVSSTLEGLFIRHYYNDTLTLDNFPKLENLDTDAIKITLKNIPLIQHITNYNYQGFEDVRDLTLENLAGLKTIVDGFGRINGLKIKDLPSLRRITTGNSTFENLVIEDFMELDTIDLNSIIADSLLVRNLPSLSFLRVNGSHNGNHRIKFMELSNCPLIDEIGRINDPFRIGGIRNLTLANMPSLKKLFLFDRLDLDKVSLSQLPVLDSIEIIKTKNLSDLQITDMPNLRSIIYTDHIWNNVVEKFHISNLPMLSNLDIRNRAIDTLSVVDLPQLTQVFLSRTVGHIEFNNLPALKDLSVGSTPLDTLILSGFENLEHVLLGQISTYNQPVYLEFTDLPKLHTLESANNIATPSISLDNLQSLRKVRFSEINLLGQEEIFESIYLNNLPVLEEIESDYFINPDTINEHNLVNLLNLKKVSLYNRPGDVNIENLPSLTHFYYEGNHEEESFYDFSSCPAITSVTTKHSNNYKADYNFKNGTNTITTFDMGGRIRNVCVDNKEEEDSLRLINDGLDETFFTTECPNNEIMSFNTIKGRLVFANTEDLCPSGSAFTKFNRVEFISDSYSSTLYSNQNGLFEFKSDNINEDIIISPIVDDNINFNLYMETDTVHFTDYDNIENVKFCLYPENPFTDYDVLLVPLTSAVPGFEVEYKLIIRNLGTTALEGTGNINLKYDPDVMTFIQESPLIIMNASDSIGWYFVNLNPFAEKEVNIKFLLNTPTDDIPLNSGDILDFHLTVDENMGDENDANDKFHLQQNVINSFDPNDISCIEGSSISKDYIGNSIHYMIRFENLGTSFAKNIEVTNRIDTTVFDLDSFMPFEASHTMQTEIYGGDTLRFIFDDIYLQPGNNNEGYLIYKINIKDGVSKEDILKNDANIYFDFNEPIYTGLSEVTFREPTSTSNISIPAVIKCYPNPTSNSLQYQSTKSISKIKIYDVIGNIRKQISVSSLLKGNIDLKDFEKGVYNVVFESSDGSRNIVRVMKY